MTEPAGPPFHKFFKYLLVAGLVGSLAFPLLFPPQYFIYVAALVFFWGAMATSWDLVGGYSGYVSLGHAAFLGVGAYTGALLLLDYQISPFLSAPFVGLITLLLGAVVGLVSLRTRAEAFVIVTLTLGLVARLVDLNLTATGGASGLPLPLYPWPASLSGYPFYYSFLALLIGALYVSHRIRHSKLGLGLMAIREDEDKAEALGVNTFYYKLLAFAISAFLVGTGGAIFSYFLTYVDPSIFGLGVSVQIVLMALIGGRGTVLGPLLGAAIYIPASEFFTLILGSSVLNLAVFGALLVIIATRFPNGIMGIRR